MIASAPHNVLLHLFPGGMKLNVWPALHGQFEERQVEGRRGGNQGSPGTEGRQGWADRAFPEPFQQAV